MKPMPLLPATNPGGSHEYISPKWVSGHADADHGRHGNSGRTGDDDLDFDAGLNQDLPRFVKGEAVLHDTFGSGTVGEVAGFGRDLKVTVHFDTVGTKRLLVRYAGLRRDFD